MRYWDIFPSNKLCCGLPEPRLVDLEQQRNVKMGLGREEQ